MKVFQKEKEEVDATCFGKFSILIYLLEFIRNKLNSSAVCDGHVEEWTLLVFKWFAYLFMSSNSIIQICFNFEIRVDETGSSTMNFLRELSRFGARSLGLSAQADCNRFSFYGEKMWRPTFTKLSGISGRISLRSYLTESYNLNNEWAKRLSTPLLQKVNIENLYYDMDTKFSQQKKISPVDVDIYANKIVDNRHTDEIADLVQKLRTTEEAANLLDSTQHALVRNYIEFNNMESLVHILNHRTQFGVFLDNYTANLLLDKLIKEKNFKLGARFATIFALQEDFSNEITTAMSLYVCHQFLSSLEPFDDLVVKPAEVVEEVPKSKKKKEEIRIRVRYIKNPFFDDHFDLDNSNHLLGKTFLYLADEVCESNEVLSNSLNILGYSLYEKFEEGNKFLAKAKGKTFFKETVEFVKDFANSNEDWKSNEAAGQFFETVQGLSTKDESVHKLIESMMEQAVQKQAAKDMEEQAKIYAGWIEEREEKLHNEINRFSRIQRLYNVEKVQKDLEDEERKLWFFENEDKLDLEIDAKVVRYPKRWFGKHKKPRVVDENYIPPDVDSRRNVK